MEEEEGEGEGEGRAPNVEPSQRGGKHRTTMVEVQDQDAPSQTKLPQEEEEEEEDGQAGMAAHVSDMQRARAGSTPRRTTPAHHYAISMGVNPSQQAQGTYAEGMDGIQHSPSPGGQATQEGTETQGTGTASAPSVGNLNGTDPIIQRSQGHQATNEGMAGIPITGNARASPHPPREPASAGCHQQQPQPGEDGQ
jgi:hypothetical protein